jgi:hypothetical protein
MIQPLEPSVSIILSYSMPIKLQVPHLLFPPSLQELWLLCGLGSMAEYFNSLTSMGRIPTLLLPYKDLVVSTDFREYKEMCSAK